MTSPLSRRQWLSRLPATAAVAGVAPRAAAALDDPCSPPSKDDPFTYCLNTSTIRGQKLSLEQEIDLAARAGYQAIEPWVHELEANARGGGLKDLAKRVRDRGLVVADVIGFFDWVVDDDARRKKGLENARRAMDLAAQVGSPRIAAPPAGATDQSNLDLFKAAERYRALCEIGDGLGVVPQVELWGFSRSLSRLGECLLVAAESGHPRACILADVYHLYKGGSPLTGMKLLSPAAVQVLHLNDYPAQPPRDKIVDAQRVYPGDGIAPIPALLRDLRRQGFAGVLSLELFNPEYYKQDAELVARTGLARMKAVARASAQPA